MKPKDLPRSKQALVLVDFMNPLDFPGADDLAPAALEAARATARLKRELSRRGVPTIYANDNFGIWDSEFGAMVQALLKQAGPSGSIAKLLKPRRGDLTVLKPMHSAFFGSPLDILLEKMGVEKLVFAGLATDICVKLTAMDGFLRGFRMAVPADCTAAESPEKKSAALEYMRDILKCDVRPLAGPRAQRAS
jgi:nicotinamidase-related amidase